LSFVPVMLGLCIVRVLAQDPVPGPPSTDPACANPPLDQCAFYANCLESRYHCGPNGYPIGYGGHFCQKFSDNRDLFDARGQQWVTDVMHCLQLVLVGDAIDATPTTCQALDAQAFASHAPCYVSTGFCTLSVQDWATVLEIVDITTVLSSWDSFKATIETLAGCGEFYAYMVERGLF
ncbi:hypothetical protein J3R83DRAFT_9460, partial [Lanmaoa asiatica]